MRIQHSLLLALGLVAQPAYSSIIMTSSGTSSVGTPVEFQAWLAISGDTLTVKLFNLSGSPAAPNDLLSSFYFDIVKDGTRPTLTYQSAVGDVWPTDKSSADVLQTQGANLMAVKAGDNTWQFKTMTPSLNLFQGFGLGTVGNNDLNPNGFNGNIVGGFDYSIYAGDVTTQNLDNTYLVKDVMTFTFSGVSGFTEADIARAGAFGLGTAPDSLMTAVVVPEPTTVVAGALLLLPFGVSTLRLLRKKRNG